MNRSYVFIPAIIALLLLTGCGGGERPNSIVDPFIGGNVGLNLYLQNGAPPPQVYDGGKTPFTVNVVIENVGESDIGPGTENDRVTARLEGINPIEFGVTDADMATLLGERVSGAHKNFDGSILGGQPANFVFPPLNYMGKLQGNQMVTIRGTVCYDYSNTATTQICIKDDILENVQDSTICTLTGEKIAHNSGGPIHITNVVQNPLSSNKVQVNFMVEHVGPGEFYGRRNGNNPENCDPSVRNTNKYRVDLNVVSQDPTARVSCYRLNNTGNGTIVMYNGAPQTVSCVVERSNATKVRVYTDTLTIRTYYRYGQFIEQPIVIQSVPQ